MAQDYKKFGYNFYHNIFFVYIEVFSPFSCSRSYLYTRWRNDYGLRFPAFVIFSPIVYIIILLSICWYSNPRIYIDTFSSWNHTTCNIVPRVLFNLFFFSRRSIFCPIVQHSDSETCRIMKKLFHCNIKRTW